MNQRAINFTELDSLELLLPYPPTVNHYWQTRVIKSKTSGKHFPSVYVSAKGKQFRKTVVEMITKNKREPLHGSLSVRVVVFPPDRRKRDLDNITKALFDSLTHAGVYLDDCQIDEFSVKRDQPVKDGKVKVIIRAN